MSASAPEKRINPRDIVRRKGGQPVVGLTAYTATTARLIDATSTSRWSVTALAWCSTASIPRCR